MRTGHCKRLVRLGAGALLVLMVYGFCAPAPAWASCSHRVGTPSALISSFYSLDELIMTGTSPVPEDDSAQSPLNWSVPGHRAPCSGLSCSGRVPIPVSTASLVHDRADQWGTLVARVMLDKSSHPAISIDGSSPHSVQTELLHFPSSSRLTCKAARLTEFVHAKRECLRIGAAYAFRVGVITSLDANRPGAFTSSLGFTQGSTLLWCALIVDRPQSAENTPAYEEPTIPYALILSHYHSNLVHSSKDTFP